MNNTISIVTTRAQLEEFAEEIVSQILERTQTKSSATSKRYVYGIRGIRDLFKVSHSTAQMYKNTFLAPAVMQRGKKLIVDADLAMELYGQTANRLNQP